MTDTNKESVKDTMVSILYEENKKFRYAIGEILEDVAFYGNDETLEAVRKVLIKYGIDN